RARARQHRLGRCAGAFFAARIRGAEAAPSLRPRRRGAFSPRSRAARQLSRQPAEHEHRQAHPADDRPRARAREGADAMKRRELFKAAALVAAVDLLDGGGAPWPSLQKLTKQKREILDQLGKMRL